MGDIGNGDAKASPRKICIIGAGLTGLGYLQALLHLPEEARQGWEIDVYESRDTPGGIWHPQANPPKPPQIPETPAYDDLETITFGNLLTFPNRPLPPSTSLFASVGVMDKYIQDHIRDFKLAPYIHLRHKVTSAELESGATETTKLPWTVKVKRTADDGSAHSLEKRYSTVIVARGITPTPRVLKLPGEEEWLRTGSGQREILHSMWYRAPDIAKDKHVIIIGDHPSGNHLALALSQVAKDVHHIISVHPFFDLLFHPTAENYHQHLSRAVSFTPNSIVLQDGSEITTPADCLLIQATGFHQDHPYFSDSLLKRVSGDTYDSDSPKLTSNEIYIRPLYKCLLPIDPAIPYGSLAFGCIFTVIFNFPTSYAQGLWFGHLLADLDANGGKSALLPDRKTALAEIQEVEGRQKAMGMDMAKKAYFLMPPGQTTDDITDQLIREVRQHSKYPLPKYLQDDPEREYTEAWRRYGFGVTLFLIKAWHTAKAEGVADSLTKGAKTEEDFAGAMRKLQAYHETKFGPLPIPGQ